ncbi:MAG: hypothetical protein U0941_30085 [Planctomycetaceae bacterium]
MRFRDAIAAAKAAFAQTIQLKLDQFHAVAPKGSNSALAGDFIEELVRGFIRDWIQPCSLLRGSMCPIDINEAYLNPSIPQIDGIVFDPRQGPSIIREGNFVVAHPQFCPGIIEIKKSETNLKEFESRLQDLHKQFYCRGSVGTTSQMITVASHAVMGIVIHDPDPNTHSHPTWHQASPSLHEIQYGGHCPIFILFKEKIRGVEYEPYDPAISSMMETIFGHGWAFDPRLEEVQRQLIADQMFRR